MIPTSDLFTFLQPWYPSSNHRSNQLNCLTYQRRKCRGNSPRMEETTHRLAQNCTLHLPILASQSMLTMLSTRDPIFVSFVSFVTQFHFTSAVPESLGFLTSLENLHLLQYESTNCGTDNPCSTLFKTLVAPLMCWANTHPLHFHSIKTKPDPTTRMEYLRMVFICCLKCLC